MSSPHVNFVVNFVCECPTAYLTHEVFAAWVHYEVALEIGGLGKDLEAVVNIAFVSFN